MVSITVRLIKFKKITTLITLFCSNRQETASVNSTVKSHLTQTPTIPSTITTRPNRQQHVLQRIHRHQLRTRAL